MFSIPDCSGRCCVCKCSGHCIAGRGDDYFTPASREEIQRRIDSGEYLDDRDCMINYMENHHDDIDRIAHMKESINVSELINEFRSMAARGTLLAREGVSQEDLLIQIEGTIVKVAMKNK